MLDCIQMVPTKERILEAALKLFNTRGYNSVGVREISRELKISPGNLSYHFHRKEDILFRLLENFSAANDGHYKAYLADTPSNENFLRLMNTIFHNQFSYRGVYIGNQSIQQELQTSDSINYENIAKARQSTFRTIFTDLTVHQQLQTDPSDVEYLTSYMTLFGRFWISEAILVYKEKIGPFVISHYLSMLAKQLSLFATEAGLQSIHDFQINHPNSMHYDGISPTQTSQQW